MSTVKSLSGRSYYYYAVECENFRQDTSDFSNIVRVRPDKDIDLFYPPTVNTYYANGKIHLDWRDVRNGDNLIDSYILQRRESTSSEYVSIETGTLRRSTYVDSLVSAGVTYHYRVAAKSLYGQQSQYSRDGVHTIPQAKVTTIDLFYTRNVTEGIKVSIPKMEFSNRSKYNVYRKVIGEDQFSKIASIDADQFNYLDRDVESGKLYVYVLTITQDDGREGLRGKSNSVRRKG